jgi:hypothetical protein
MAEELSKLADCPDGGTPAAYGRITLGDAYESKFGKVVPVLLDGAPFTLYLPMMRAPQGIKRWDPDKKKDERTKYELPLMPEKDATKWFSVMDEVLVSQLEKNQETLLPRMKVDAIRHRYECFVRDQKDPKFAPTVRPKVPYSGNRLLPAFIDEDGNNIEVHGNDYMELVPYHARIRAACHLHLFIGTLGIFPTLTLHLARVHQPDGTVVSQPELDFLNTDMPKDSKIFKRTIEQVTADDIEKLNGDAEKPAKRAKKAV